MIRNRRTISSCSTIRKGLTPSTIFLCILASITVLTQCVPDNVMLGLVMRLTWVLQACFLFVAARGRVFATKFFIRFFISYIFLICYSLFLGAFINDDFFDSIYVNSLLIPFSIYIIGYYATRYSEESIRKFCIVYILATFFLCIYLIYTYVGTFSTWINASSYLIRQKNSAGQIVSVAIILLLVLNDRERLVVSILRYFLVGLLAVFLLILQCRSSMVGLCLAGVYWFHKLKGRKKWLIILSLILLFLLLFYDKIVLLISVSLRLDAYQGADLNTISSGRIDLIYNALLDIAKHPFIGNGQYYVDMFFVSVIAELGLIGAIVIFQLYFARIRHNFKYQVKFDGFNLNLFLRMTSLFYLAVSFFEAISPFGPGVSCFMFWFFCGFRDSLGAKQQDFSSKLPSANSNFD